MSDELKLGYEKPSGEQVDIPVFHSVITGITRHGKSETMRALAERAQAEGYTILAFDVKNPRDYDGLGVDIPIYLEEHTDPTTLKGLLENQSGMGLNFQFSELIKMYEPGDTYYDMLDRMEASMAEDIHPVEEDKLRVLIHLLADLTEELDRVDISDELELQEGSINVMDLHDVDNSIQQLAIAGSVGQILSDHRDVIILLDEAHNFIPQRRQPPARDPLVKAIREGAANNNWLWISDQTITGVDKDPLKQVGVWVLGKQREKNEAKRVLDQIPGSTSYSSDDVMTLDKGHFIVALDDAQPHTYVQPTWLGGTEARQIAAGDAAVANHEPPEQEAPDMDTTLQEKETELQEKEQRIRELEEQLAVKNEEIESLEAKVDALFEEQTETGESPGQPSVETVGDEEQIGRIVDERLEAAIQELELPEAVLVDASQPRIEVRRRVEPVRVSVDENDPKGVVAYLYASGELPAEKWMYSGEFEELAEQNGFNITLKRTGILTEFCRMGLMEKDQSNKYRFTMSSERAKEKDLLQVEEAVA